MKKILRILFVLIMFTFVSCASNEISKETQIANASKNKTLHNTEKLRFNDWKYKGFGNELPLWVENAVNHDENALKNMIDELKFANEIQIITGRGENLDQAEQKVKIIISEKGDLESSYKLYDNFWVRENLVELKDDFEDFEKLPYISIYVYYKNIIEEIGDF